MPVSHVAVSPKTFSAQARRSPLFRAGLGRMTPVAQALALLLAAGGALGSGNAHAAQPFSAGWYGSMGVNQRVAAATGYTPNGKPASAFNPGAQQQAANTQLQQSIANLTLAAHGIAMMQAQQASWRKAALGNPSTIPNGLGVGGLDTGSLASSWINAIAPTTQTTDANGNIVVDIQQTGDKAIANWETFNVGKNTIVQFDQASADWAILNRIGNSTAPSTIQGQIRAPGTVLIVNKNGILFSGSSQINVRNLVAAAADISDSQFTTDGIYGANQAASFTNANGSLIVEAGAQITTAAPTSATQGGGYVLLMGQSVSNAGDIETPKGQIEMAAGDSFIIRKGVGTDANQSSTTRGNEISPQFNVGSTSGQVTNTGLLLSREGDITMAGHDVEQNGVAVATTTVNTRGTIHLLNSASDATGLVALGANAITTIAIQDDGATALDSQRDALIKDSTTQDAARPGAASGVFDNLSKMADREDQSRIEIVSGGDVRFEGGSLSLATGGQIAVSATGNTLVAGGAKLDVSGAVGVNLAMASNNISVNVQGNELRDAPLNRDSGALFNNNVWVDARDLIYVPAGTDGYASDRWYTAGGLLEVSGYLSNTGHGIGEWSAQGGTIQLSANAVTTEAGSQINLSGGSINVATGYIHQTWLKGSDGQLYSVDNAPADMTFTGVYKGFEVTHPRWGVDTTVSFYNPLIAPQKKLQNGYTIGRDAGELIVSAPNALMRGNIVADVYNGPQQTNARPAGADDIDGYKLGQTQAALQGRLTVEMIDPTTGLAMPVAADVVFGKDAPPATPSQGIWLDATALSGFNLGGIAILTTGDIAVDAALTVAPGGAISLAGTDVDVNANITTHGGSIFLGENDSVLRGLSNLGRNLVGSVDVASGATLDTRGLWTNLLTDPDTLSGLPFIDGGNISLHAIGDVTLNDGARIDASAGGAILADGKTKGGAGGDITLFANDTGGRTVAGIGVLTLDGEIHSYGFTHGGALAINTGTAVAIEEHAPAATTDLVLTPGFFSKGFASYSINGNAGLTVAPNTDIDVVQPVYRFTGASLAAPTGSDTGSAAEVWTPPLYLENPITAQLTQRAGADLTLLSGIDANIVGQAVGGSIDIARGATITVDPGRSVRVASGGQINIDGKIAARGGNISVVNNRPLGGTAGPGGVDPGGLAIWIGEHAVLDASAPRDSFAYDTQGRPYGFVMDGGSIVLGSDGGDNDANKNKISTDALVIVRPGAVVDASGASAVLNPDAGTSVSLLNVGAGAGMGAGFGGARIVASNGGSITMRSYDGIYNDGTLRAASGGDSAAGGALVVELESPVYIYDPSGGGIAAIPPNMRAGRVITIGEGRAQNGLPTDIQPGEIDPALIVGQARIDAQKVEEGGFDTLSFYARSGIAFDGDVTLNAGRSISLLKGPLSNTVAGGNATLNAPYIFLGGQTEMALPHAFSYVPGDVQVNPAGGDFSANASLIDVQNTVQSGFVRTQLASTGDLRFLKSDDTPSVGLPTTNLIAHGNLDIVAAQIYPASGALVNVYAGVDGVPSGSAVFGADSLISIGLAGGATPRQPYSVFGNISFLAESIMQGGVVRAPLGSITFGQTFERDTTGTGAATTSLVEFGTGSITSISAAGLLIPYGGTADGVKYTVDGAAPATPNAVTGTFSDDANAPMQGIRANGVNVVGAAGAFIDVSGGGTLTGAAFVSGRGGSVDTLLHPLNPGATVYAIVPGAVTAPVAGGADIAWTGATPGIGQQITIPAGVPGLPAGTYTLLPANYALLPGAYRIELGARATRADAGVFSLPNGSYAMSGIQSIANTAIRDALSTSVTVTPGATLRSYSQYNEQSYDAFEQAQAATLGLGRPLLPVDGKFLWIHLAGLPVGSAPIADQALVFDGKADFNAGAGGYGGTLIINGQGGQGVGPTLTITGPGSPSLRSEALTPVTASAIDAFDAPNLYVGGSPLVTPSNSDTPGKIVPGNKVATLTVEDGALLTGAQITLVGDIVTLASGARVSSLGQSVLAPAMADGYILPGSALASNVSLRAALLDIQDGSAIYADGGLLFEATFEMDFGNRPQFGARSLTLSLPTINIGGTDALAAAAAAGTLPPGLRLDQALLDRLLNGDSAAGVPAIENLSLAAWQSINFYGSVDLNTFDAATGKFRLSQFILDSPAVYGYGTAADSAHLNVDTLVWNNIGTPPGPIVANGPGSGLGALDIDANQIVFGYPAQSQPNRQIASDHVVLGFSNVNLNAADRITANGNVSLAVYASGPDPALGFDPKTYAGTDGNLNLVSPLLTGDPGSVMRYKVGGALTIATPSGIAASTIMPSALGAEIDMSAGAITVSSAIVLPSGKLTMTAANDITLADGSRIDLSGQTIPFFDVNKYSWGGDVSLESTHGNIVQAATSVIDISAGNEDAGTLTLTATDPNAGQVLLNGTLRGSGGAGHSGGAIDIRAQRIGASATDLSSDFAALNNVLGAGGFFGARSFDLKQGDLSVGSEVRARQVTISVDGGSLSIDGTIDASGAMPGSIRLAARDDLTLTSHAVLDVHGTALQVDSDGQPIEAKNRGEIELTSSEGWLRLNSGAAFDLSSPDNVARGRIELNAGRTGGVSGHDDMAGDIRIEASGPLAIGGAGSITVNGFWQYSPTDADGTIVQDNGSADPVNIVDGSVGLNQIDQRSVAFIDAALANGDLQNRLAGLMAFDTSGNNVFHLRPGVEINSKDTPNGNLTVKGDLDLSGFRYGANADRNPGSATYGAGEAGSFVIRASGNLDIDGSISDGFAPPPVTTDDTGWQVMQTLLGAGQTSTSEINFQTQFNAAIGVNVYFFPGTDPVTFQTSDPQTVVSGSITDGNRTYFVGDTLPGYLIGAVTIAPNTQLSTVDPADAVIALLGPGPARQVWALAPMLAAGSLSASLRLVSGADQTAADTRTLRAASALHQSGDMTLNDPHFSNSTQEPIFSVIRTGTGNLDLLAAGNFAEKSRYGIYTAGTNTLLPDGNADFSSQGTYYPDHGGDMRVVAQGTLAGMIYQELFPSTVNSYSVADWLWRQGDDVSKSAWSINFGSYVPGTNGGGNPVMKVVGFEGFGALGGGNVLLQAGGDAGNLQLDGAPIANASTGLVVAVGGTGRVTSVTTSDGAVTGGNLIQTGGGDVIMKIGGRLNPGAIDSNLALVGDDFNGVITNVRGDIRVDAGAIGAIPLQYALNETNDPRGTDPYTAALTAPGGPSGGLVLVPGDTNVMLRSRGDLVLGGVGDPGQVIPLGLDPSAPGEWFTLWRPSTSIDLFSAGGNLTPLRFTTQMSANETWTAPMTQVNALSMLPSRFSAVAASGSLYYGAPVSSLDAIVELMPSDTAQLELFAQKSIYAAADYSNSSVGGAMRFDVSGATFDVNAIPNPFKPAFKTGQSESDTNTNGDPNFFAFTHDTVTTSTHAGNPDPIRIYANTGDIVNFQLGEQTLTSDPFTGQLYVKNIAAAAAQVRAGRDIVGFGNLHPTQRPQVVQPSLIMNADDTDVSVIAAGRDMFYTNVMIAGPGSLEVSAGRNLYQGDSGSVTSIGPIADGDVRPGASIFMQAGAGASGPDYAALAARYLNADNLANPGLPLADQAGKVAKTYDDELVAWLKGRYAFDGTASEALSYFDTLAPEQRNIFLRQVYYAELLQGGREYNDPDSRRFGSYLRGRDMIATLFPDADADGNPIVRQGDITLFGGSGVRTLFGGDIQMLAPGGQIVVGVQGEAPPSTSGVVTQGSGDIELYSKGSVLLGLSRIMTTFGGDILAWSAEGDINAGRGSKTTLVYTPPKLVYDDFGNVTLSPDAPSTGAGIATLNPLPEVPPGDVDLIAPLGTIDVGEAGIRVSGNINLAALQVANAANIDVKGKATGIPTLAAVNVGALTNAGAAATQAAMAAQDVVSRERNAARQALPSIFTVRVLSFGNEEPEKEDAKSRQQGARNGNGYDATSAIQVLGDGALTATQSAALTPKERNNWRP